MKNAPIERRIDEFLRGELEALKGHRAAGGLAAAYFYPRFPPEILAGLGIFPLRLAEGGTYLAEREGEKLIRPDACPYCKSLAGNFRSKSGLFGLADMLVGVTTCDMMRRTLEVMASDSDIPVFQLQMPATRSANSERYFVREVARTAGDLGKFCKRPFDAAAAREYFEARKSCAETLWKIISGAGLPPLAAQRLRRLFDVARPGQLEQFLKRLEAGGKHSRRCRRILIVGSAICYEDDLVLRILQERGAEAIVLGISENGPSGFYSGAGLKASAGRALIQELAARSFRADVCIRHRPNSGTYSEILGAIGGLECDGVILKCLKFCDLWYSEKERMKQTLGVPLLVLDTTYSSSEAERIRNRVEAFLEMLK